jgi:hypothetical protein
MGYTLIGFDPSDELNDLSRNMDNSRGGFRRLNPFPDTFSNPLPPEDLEGAHVDARDTFTWHLTGGAELGFRKNWSAFLDLRYTFASRSMSISFNGSDSLGSSVPDRQVYDTEPLADLAREGEFGAYSITDGGLIDGGVVKAKEGFPADTDCDREPQNCDFFAEPDGILDPGTYYVQGGDLRYDNITLHVGIRYTF